MAPSKTYVWICLALCVSIGGSEVFYRKTGENVNLGCGEADHNKHLEWKHNDNLIIRVRTGITKGTTDVAKRAKLSESILKVSQLGTADSGVYRCTGLDTRSRKVTAEHTVYVMSASASPSPTVLHSTELNLNCDVHDDPKASVENFQWMTPLRKPYGSPGKAITLKSVKWTDSGSWTCQIKANGKVENIAVDITVLGPLTCPAEVTVPAGGSADLNCSLPSVSLPHVEKGGWSRDSPNGFRFPTLQAGPKWNGESTSRVTFSKEKLDHFRVTLNKVSSSDKGQYICLVVFKNGQNLNTSVTLKVEQKVANIGTVKVNMWIWVGAAAALVLLIGLVIIIVLIHRRNKHMRRKVRKLRSMRQGRATNYCQCDRTNRQTHPGKRERPPPLARYQYDVMD